MRLESLAPSVIIFCCLVTGSASTSNLAVRQSHGYESQDYGRICPLPTCKECPSVKQLRAPGVGLALETSHGTAVVRLHDGTSHDVALVEGDIAYTALMRKLATGPMNRTPDHFDGYWEKLRYLKARTKRLSNKLLGRPATSETAVLASMVSKLLKATEKWLGDKQRVVAAVLSSSDRIRLTGEETNDIFDYLKLRNLIDGSSPVDELYATSAAYAGYGKGLCSTYIDAYTCEREEAQLPVQRVLHVDFNSESLSGTLKTLQAASDRSVDGSFVEPDLGFGRETVRLAMATSDHDNDGHYWTAVSDRIRELVKSLQQRVYMPNVTELLLTGPSAVNENFQTAVTKALQDLVAEEKRLDLFSIGNNASDQERWESLFSFATARGAAEIAKRRQEGPVGCAQSYECRRRREQEHDEPNSMLLDQLPGQGHQRWQSPNIGVSQEPLLSWDARTCCKNGQGKC